MTSAKRIWMTRQDCSRLQNELVALRSRRVIEVPGDFMDYDANLIARYSARQARIREIQDLLTNAVVGEDGAGEGIAEPGMVLTIRYDGTGETETFLLGRRRVEDADIKAYSMRSPLGHAIAGARPGERRNYSIPNGASLAVTLLKVVPYGMHAERNSRRRDGAGRRPKAIRTASARKTTRTPKTSRRGCAAMQTGWQTDQLRVADSLR